MLNDPKLMDPKDPDGSNEAQVQSTVEALRACIPLLQKVAADSQLLALLSDQERIDLIASAGRISRPDRLEIKKRSKDRRRYLQQAVVEKEKRLRAATGIRTARQQEIFQAPRQIVHDARASGPDRRREPLQRPRNCYVCKTPFFELHHFYDALCPECAQFNYQKRFQTAPLDGQVALITGGRLKIGYQAALMMLKAGAAVIVTTRFPRDAALRFSREADFDRWSTRLNIHGLDLRHTPSVELFCDHIQQTFSRLDLLINNAAQTVRRPPAFYAHLMDTETAPAARLPESVRPLLASHQDCIKRLDAGYGPLPAGTRSLANPWHRSAPGIGLRKSAGLSQIPYTNEEAADLPDQFPGKRLDADLQQLDLRKTNSWRLRLGEIQTAEMLELQLVNSVAPFVLCNRLIEMMKRDHTGQKHIVNVSAMEGKFMRFKKGSRHPHTNMAKAALNMLTHTAAEDLARIGIFMNAVDTGWVTDEDPAELAQAKQERHDFQPPLDIVDGAARICDPFFHGILTGNHMSGKFLKDYFPIDW